MLLQTNSYIVPKEKRGEHSRLLRRFRQTLSRLGCEHFEVYEQVGQNWTGGESTGRFVQIMRFRDRKHQLAVQNSERTDPQAQALINEFCELINFPYQQQQGLFVVGFYSSAIPIATAPARSAAQPQLTDESAAAESDDAVEELAESEEQEEEAGAAEAQGESLLDLDAPTAPATGETTASQPSESDVNHY
ncbi:MAG TPA: hypothetical protein VIL86_11400 [Tepidisphaeraceae bacterium]